MIPFAQTSDYTYHICYNCLCVSSTRLSLLKAGVMHHTIQVRCISLFPALEWHQVHGGHAVFLIEWSNEWRQVYGAVIKNLFFGINSNSSSGTYWLCDLNTLLLWAFKFSLGMRVVVRFKSDDINKTFSKCLAHSIPCICWTPEDTEV